MFRGTHQYLVDDKGRVAIPARFREVLSGLQDERLVGTKFRRRGRPCLDVYPLSGWQRFEEKIATEKRCNRKQATSEAYYIGSAQDGQLHAQASKQIPPRLRAHERLSR